MASRMRSGNEAHVGQADPAAIEQWAMPATATMASPMRNGKQGGFTYLSLMILVAMIGLASAASIKLGSILQRSAAERELLAIGAEYADALESYAKATPPGQSPLPPSFKELLRDTRFPNVRRHLRRVYVDPMTGKAEWGIVYANSAQMAQPGQGGMAGAHPGAGPAAPASGGAVGGPGNPGAPVSAPASGMARGTGAGVNAGAGTRPGATSSLSQAMQQGGTAGIVAFYSLSDAKPVKVGNFPARFQGFDNRSKISDWKFARADAQPGQPPQPGQQPVVPPSEPVAEPAPEPAVPPSPQPEIQEMPPAEAPARGEEPAPEDPPQDAQASKAE